MSCLHRAGQDCAGAGHRAAVPVQGVGDCDGTEAAERAVVGHIGGRGSSVAVEIDADQFGDVAPKPRLARARAERMKGMS